MYDLMDGFYDILFVLHIGSILFNDICIQCMIYNQSSYVVIVKSS